jgi:hypothetical protein
LVEEGAAFAAAFFFAGALAISQSLYQTG